MGNTINIISEVSEITVTPEQVTVNVLPEEYTIAVGDGPQGPVGPGVAAGGTAGQILAKASATNYDTEWIDNDAYRVIELVKCGVPVTKGQAVYVTGATGANVIVGLAQADADMSSATTLAIAAESGATNDFIKVVLIGVVSDINTAAATAGDPVWLSPTTAGGLLFGMANKPSAPNHLVYMGVVVRAHANQGVIQVHIVNGFELEELHDVAISSPASGQVLTYNGSLWVNSAPAGDITAVTVSSPITGGGTSGSVSIGFDQSAQDTVNDTRYARLGAANAFTVGGHTITNTAAAVVPLVIQGAASQSANLLTFRDSVGAAIGAFNANAQMYASRVTVGGGVSSAARLTVLGVSATDIQAVIRGAASQTANLQEWQNSSGTILARVASTGTVWANAIWQLNGRLGIFDANSGGNIQFQKATAAVTNPGSGYATLYFRDGTNAGTLRLVVRAGAAGAETTILDNIPQ